MVRSALLHDTLITVSYNVIIESDILELAVEFKSSTKHLHMTSFFSLLSTMLLLLSYLLLVT